ncbi:response regulator [bacterium]|nr:response regulator [bacterium]
MENALGEVAESRENERIKVLYIDDEVENLRSFKAVFRREFDVEVAESGAQGVTVFETLRPDVVITDQRMPGMTGIELLEAIQKINSAPIRMLLTGYSDISAVIDAINRGQVYRYLTKPWNEGELRNAIHSAFEVYDLRRRNSELLKALERANEQLEFLLRQKLLS